MQNESVQFESLILCDRLNTLLVDNDPNQDLIALFNENVDSQKTAIVIISSDTVADYAKNPMMSFSTQLYFINAIDAMTNDVLLINGHVQLTEPAGCNIVSDTSFSKLNNRMYDRVADLFGVSKNRILLVDDNLENRGTALDAGCKAADPAHQDQVKQAILVL